MEILELLDWKFKTGVVNRLRVPIEKVHNMHELLASVSRETGILKKNLKEMVETKNTVTESENAFDRSLEQHYEFGDYYYPYLTNEETEAQRAWVRLQRRDSHSGHETGKPGLLIAICLQFLGLREKC